MLIKHSYTTAFLLAASCYCNPDFAGLPCEADSECGDLRCIDGLCSSTSRETSESLDTVQGTHASLGTTQESTQSFDTIQETTGILDVTSTVAGSTTTAETDSGSECCEMLDLLLVIDQSFNMECYEDALNAAILELEISGNLFTNGLKEKVGSLHIGITFAQDLPENPPGCQTLGSLVQGRFGEGYDQQSDCSSTLLEGRPYATENDNLLAAMWCLFGAGTTPENQTLTPEPVLAMLNALSPEMNGPGGCNEGFFRPEAPLVVFFFTNVDAREPHPPDLWTPALVGLNGDIGAPETWSRIGFAAIVGPDAPEEGCSTQAPTLMSERLWNNFEHNDTLNICDLQSMSAPTPGCPDCPVCGGTVSPDIESVKTFLTDRVDEIICGVCGSD